jgi:hypothetical protein
MRTDLSEKSRGYAAALSLEKIIPERSFMNFPAVIFPFDKQYLVLLCTMLIFHAAALAGTSGRGHRLKVRCSAGMNPNPRKPIA